MHNFDVNDRDGQGGPTPILSLVGVSKRFPGVTALENIDFTLHPGEVHVLFGENGAGKSTLINIITGALTPSDGHMLLNGDRVQLDSVYAARKAGISAVFQEFSLVPQLTVAENIFLGGEKEHSRFGLISGARIRKQARHLLDELGFSIPVDRSVGHLARAEQQMVEIAKALRWWPSLLILDEPTASLTDHEAQRLYALVEALRERGAGIIYISHRMEEVRRLADRITVLRDGRHIATLNASDADEDRLVQLMTGRSIEAIFPEIRHEPRTEKLECRDLTTRGDKIVGANIEAYEGEIVGLAGLVGSGKSEVIRAMFGASEIQSGSIHLRGDDITRLSIRARIRKGMFYVTADRRNEGMILMASARENIMLPALDLAQVSTAGVVWGRAERAMSQKLAQDVDLQPPNTEQQASAFSGGNQQKIMLARAMARGPSCFLFDEPTVGVDVGARAAIYKFLRDLCEAGAIVIIVSSELPEITHLSHRAYVVNRAKVQTELSGDELTESNIARHFIE